MNLTDTCIRRPVLAWMLMAGVVLFGTVALTRIGVSQFPDVDFPSITVIATWEGAAPDIIEAEVVEPLEEALIQVEGVRAISATCSKGQGRIVVEFGLERDIDVALQEVQARVTAQRRRLPPDLDEPTYNKSNPEDSPIMWIALSGPFPPQQLADWARYQVKERIQTVPGVGEISLGGLLERNVRIWIRPDDLDRYGLTVGELVERLRANHVELPAGVLRAGGREISVRVLGEAFDLGVLRSLPIGGTREAPVLLEQVALVEDGFADVDRIARVDGLPAQGLGIRKQRGANAVEVGDRVRAAIEELRTSLPPGMELGVNYDATPYIAATIRELRHEILLSILLTALVCWAFLRSWSSTLNVLLAIPMSLLGAVAVTYWLGWTLNTFTLLGLGLAVGIVVDDAILVMENIVRRREGGEPAPEAASRGTREIAFSALAATIAIIAIVIPVVFMEGVQGRFFLQFGVALCVAVALSYVEAVTLAPARCATLLARHGESTRRGALGRAFDALLAGTERRYAGLLGASLRHPRLVAGVGLAFSVASVVMLIGMPRELVPSQDVGRLRLRISTPVGTEILATDRFMREAEAVVRAHPAVDRVFAITGWGGSNAGAMMVNLRPRGERAPQAEVQRDLRTRLAAIPGMKGTVFDPSQEGFSSSRFNRQIEFALVGSDWDLLVAQADAVRGELERSGVAVDVESDWQLGAPELRIAPRRDRLADAGVPVEALARTVETLVGGARVGKFSVDGRRIDVRAQLVAEARRDREDVLDLRVRTRDGGMVPLSMLVDASERPAPQTITRRDRQRAITISANVAAGSSQDRALTEVERIGRGLPPEVRLALTGQSQAVGQGMTDLAVTMILGVIVAYMVLAAQFNSFAHPLTVLTILPLSLAGGATMLLLSGYTLNLFSGIGFILLMGLAKKNSIVLVDFAARRQEQGGDARTAMLEAAPLRLRPILMTSVATIVAALPIALGLGEGSETRAPMALAIVGGMVVATTLSLLVVPAVYVLIDRIRPKRQDAEAVAADADAVDDGQMTGSR